MLFVYHDALVSVPTAEYWLVLIVIVDVEVIDHFVPMIDPALFNGTSDVGTCKAILILTLNDCSVAHLAEGALSF